mmetsp:Transcript_17681/g.20432  ORF Transcript_17681/g.20432 Transcript_17681/m.20432 type:complete len:234 (-) Transcript_17681:23-724(-)
MGDYKLDEPVWDLISEEGKDLVKKLLTYDSTRRLSAYEALRHPWLSKFIDLIDATEVTTKALLNLKGFKAEQKMQQAAITFIVQNLASHEEFNELQIAFKDLDQDMDGKLTHQEITAGYKKYLPETTDEEITRILEIADADGSGEIDYWEWVVSTIDKTKLLSEAKMRAAFSLFDKDGGGTITPDEIKETLGIKGKKIDDNIWDEIVKEVDDDGNAEISYIEFKEMMEKLITK